MATNINDLIIENTLSATTITATTMFIGGSAISTNNSTFSSLSAATISGGTLYSGNTDISTLFATPQNISLINSQLVTKGNLSGATFTGGIISPSISANTLSGGTLYSGTTELSVVMQNLINSNETFVQNGLNVYTGGTNLRPTVNISAATLSSLNVSGNSFFNSLSSSTLSGSTFYSGNTDVSTLFATPQNIVSINSQLITKANLSGANFTGNVISPSLSSTTISGGTLYSGSTDVSLLFATPQNISLINSQLITKANLSGATFTGGVIMSGLSAATVSGGTLYSGSTELSVIMQTLINSNETFVQNGLNTYTAGTVFRPTVNISGATLNNLNVSGNSTFNNLSTVTLSASTILSGNTDISTLFATPQNITSINAQLATKANLSGATFTGTVISSSISANTISGNTIYSGSTDLSLQFASSILVNSHTSQFATKANLSGATFTGNVVSTSLSANTISGSTLYSGSTDLSLLFATPQNINLVNAQLGTKANLSGATFTGAVLSPSITATTISGGTLYSGNTDVSLLFATPQNISLINSQLITKANLSGATFTGNVIIPNFSAVTISGSTIFSANTDISTLFATPQNITSINSQLTTKANLSGATFTGGIIAPSISANTISGGTLYSGSTELSVVIQNLINPDETFIQNGLNTYTGGTNFRPTINISAATLSVLNVSGSSVFNSLSANTISGSTLYSGLTDVSLLFATPQNINSINSQLLSKANLSAATFTGIITTPILSATTISGNTLYSGTSNLGQLFINTAATIVYLVGQGTNIITGGTNINPIVNLNSSIAINNLTFSGTAVGGALSATSISASTGIYTLNNLNIGLYPNYSSGTLSVQSTSGQPQTAVFEQYGFAANARFRSANGTPTSPTATLSGNVIGNFNFAGYNGSAFTGGGARVRAIAAENWNTTANGTYFEFAIIPTGTTAQVPILLLNADATVSVGNISTLNPANPEKLLVSDSAPYGSFSNTIVGAANAQTYAQISIQNFSATTSGSSDLIATADNGNEVINYVDLGINGSINNLVGGGAANDGYLYSTGNDFWIGNSTSNKNLNIFTDVFDTPGIRLTINSAYTNVTTTLRAPSFSASTISGNTAYIFDGQVPLAPTSGTTIYSDSTALRRMLGQISFSGTDYIYQPSLFSNRISLWNPPGNSTTVPGVLGFPALTATGTATARNVATTNLFNRARRLGLVSTALAGNFAGFRNAALQYTVGDGAGNGGFMYVIRFGVADAVTVGRMFIGLRNTTAAPTNVEPSTLTNCIGIGSGAADTNLKIFYGGSAAQTAINLGANFPTDTNTTDIYEFTLYSNPGNSNTVGYKVVRLNTGNEVSGILTGTAGTALPANTTLLTINDYRTNNTSNTAVALDYVSIYMETDN